MKKNCLWCDWSERLRQVNTDKLTRFLGCSAKLIILDADDKNVGCKLFKSIDIPECDGCKYFFIDGIKQFQCRVRGGFHLKVIDGNRCEMYENKKALQSKK